MKKFVMAIALCLMCAAAVSAKTTNDTIPFTGNIQRTIIDSTLNSKGNFTKKYYLVVNNRLVDTNKKTLEAMKLALKYKVNVDLYAIVDKSTNKVKKVIAL